MQKTTLTLMALIICMTGFSQTKRIAHLSHSGSNANLYFDFSDNVGLPSPRITVDSFVKISDTVVIATGHDFYYNVDKVEKMTIPIPLGLEDYKPYLDSITAKIYIDQRTSNRNSKKWSTTKPWHSSGETNYINFEKTDTAIHSDANADQMPVDSLNKVKEELILPVAGPGGTNNSLPALTLFILFFILLMATMIWALNRKAFVAENILEIHQ